MIARGDMLPQTKLTISDVLWIRRNRHGMTAALQAALLNVHKNSVDRARTGDNFGWIR